MSKQFKQFNMVFACLVVSNIAWGGLAPEQEEPESEVLVRINERFVSERDVKVARRFLMMDENIRRLPPSEQEKILTRMGTRKAVIRAIAEQFLLEQEAKRIARDKKMLDIAKSMIERRFEKRLAPIGGESNIARAGITAPELRKQIRTELEIERLMAYWHQNIPDPTPQQIKQHYNKHRDKYVKPARYGLRVIMIGNTDASVESLARKVREEAIAPSADFAALAEKHNFDPAVRKLGGKLNEKPFVTDEDIQRRLGKTIHEAVQKLKPGEISPVIDYGRGFAILYLESFRPAEAGRLEDVRDRIRRELTYVTRQEYQKKRRRQLLEAAHIFTPNGVRIPASFFYSDDEDTDRP